MAVERMGLNMQRDVAFRHCLQPRCTLAAWQSFAWWGAYNLNPVVDPQLESRLVSTLVEPIK
jgi:hypothetical protein